MLKLLCIKKMITMPKSSYPTYITLKTLPRIANVLMLALSLGSTLQHRNIVTLALVRGNLGLLHKIRVVLT